MMTILDRRSNKKLTEFLVNTVLLGIVLVSWFYVLYAGRVATLRYLEKLDFSETVERITVLQLAGGELSSENGNSTLET